MPLLHLRARSAKQLSEPLSTKIAHDLRRVSGLQLARHEQLLAQLAGRKLEKRTIAGRTGASAGGNVPSGRIDWKNVLAQLPNQFKASNVRQVRGLADKRPSEIFAGITRWIEAGSVKRTFFPFGVGQKYRSIIFVAPFRALRAGFSPPVGRPYDRCGDTGGN